jgi:outer membrane protein OmpA-like peptidoglycan-associated protein
MMKNIVFLLCMGVFSGAPIAGVAAQEHADCTSPFILGVDEYHCDPAPDGPGLSLEINGNGLKSNYFIDKEHNTVWYKFVANKDGMLTFTITPDNPANDYDFMLYLYNGDNACDKIIGKSILPVRTNFARNKPSQGGKTGLSSASSKEFVTSGPGENFSKGLAYKKGDVFYLLVDNVYRGGKGHTIKLDGFFEKNDEKVGDTALIAANSNADGKYDDAGSNANSDKSNANDDSSNEVAAVEDEGKGAGKSADMEAMELEKAGGKTADGSPRLVGSGKTPADLKNNLKSLKPGQALILDNVYFHGNSAFLKTESKEHMEALYEYLRDNPSVKIVIGGHTNGHQKAQTHYIPLEKNSDIFAKDQFSMLMSSRQIKGNTKKLSEFRAEVIKNYLETKGISPERLKFVGWGAEKMIFPEQSDMNYKNRRVEIELF